MPQTTIIVPINVIAVIVAAVANMVIGFLWFGPLFGKQWMKWMGFTHADMEKAKSSGGMGKMYFLALIGALVMSYVLAHSIVFASAYLQVEGLTAGLMGGFWNWLGFVAPVTLGAVLWEGKSWNLWILTNAYYLVALVVMGSILVMWK